MVPPFPHVHPFPEGPVREGQLFDLRGGHVGKQVLDYRLLLCGTKPIGVVDLQNEGPQRSRALEDNSDESHNLTEYRYCSAPKML